MTVKRQSGLQEVEAEAWASTGKDGSGRGEEARRRGGRRPVGGHPRSPHVSQHLAQLVRSRGLRQRCRRDVPVKVNLILGERPPGGVPRVAVDLVGHLWVLHMIYSGCSETVGERAAGVRSIHDMASRAHCGKERTYHSDGELVAAGRLTERNRS